MTKPITMNIGGILVEAKFGKWGEPLSRRTRYRATPVKSSKYVVWPKDLAGRAKR